MFCDAPVPNIISIFWGSGRNLAGLDGLRSISMMWIIFAHTQLLSLSLGADNQNSETMLRDSLPQQFTLGVCMPHETHSCGRGALKGQAVDKGDIGRFSRTWLLSSPVCSWLFKRVHAARMRWVDVDGGG